MELYKVPRHVHIKAQGQVFYFSHLDGMYSYCKDEHGNVVHLAAWTEVEIVKGFEDE